MKKREFSLIAIVGMILISQLFASCIYGIRGTGKVIKSEREVKNFNAIKVSNGLDLILSQDSTEKVLVEADENLQEIIKTDVSNGVLKIYTTERISHASSMKVYVTLKNVTEVESSSGSDVKSTSMLDLPDLKLVASSGSDVTLSLRCNNLDVKSSSGSDVSFSGKTGKLYIESSSGSDVDAEKLESEDCSVTASSGSDIELSVSKKIKAHASSGSEISVKGNPPERDIEQSSGGRVKLK